MSETGSVNQAGKMQQELSANYQYWRNEGHLWGEEYDSRKKRLIYYHLQELFLADYFQNSKPARVLEYGCGVGRHLRYLSQIPEIEIYGYDQSLSMVSNCLRWMTQEWIDQHIVVGAPVGKLPYPDKYFDVVFTSEVLIHVRPEDVCGLLQELIRISKWQVVNLEPAPGFQVSADSHNGCWNHDLVSLFTGLGYECEILPPMFSAQAIYRTVFTQDRSVYTPSLVNSQLYQDAEKMLQPTINTLETDRAIFHKKIQELQANELLLMDSIQAYTEETNQQKQQLVSLKNDIKDLESKTANFQQIIDYERERAEILYIKAQRIQDSREYQLGKKVAGVPFLGSLIDGIIKGKKTARAAVQFVKKNNPYALSLKRQILYEANTQVEDGSVRVIAARERNPESLTDDVWLVAIQRGENYLKVDGTNRTGKWQSVEIANGDLTSALVATGPGFLDIPVQQSDKLIFRTNAWSGIVRIKTKDRIRQIDLYSYQEGFLEFRPSDGLAWVLDKLEKSDRDDGRKPYYSSPPHFSEAEKMWIGAMRKAGQPVSINNPEWLGIRHSSIQLFEHNLELKDELDQLSARHYAKLLYEAQAPAVVVQGFPLTYKYLVDELAEYNIPVYAIWHGGFIQSDEDYGWQGFSSIINLCREGKIRKVGFVKKGMAEILSEANVPSSFIMNYVGKLPDKPSVPLPNGPHIGIWANFRKRPYVMMAAGKMTAGAQIHVWNGSERIVEFNKLLSLNANIDNRSIPQPKMDEVLAQMDINLNVSLYECAPMLPLQSLSVGVPCLFGPHSHYFEDHPYLYSRLVVPSPDRSDVIAHYIQQALKERNQIIEAYQEYVVKYNAEAKASVERFFDPDTE